MPKGFGYCEFEDVDGALVCIKTMNGLEVGNSTLVVSILTNNNANTLILD
jgi:RNA recognition motif-containing protein